jgi:hypothetical protein
LGHGITPEHSNARTVCQQDACNGSADASRSAGHKRVLAGEKLRGLTFNLFHTCTSN